MTNTRGQKLTAQGTAIVYAINRGIAMMTPARWAEEAEKAAQHEDEGEWFAPEFADAREATEGLQWDFDGWRNALGYIMDGSGKIGGVSMIAEEKV